MLMIALIKTMYIEMTDIYITYSLNISVGAWFPVFIFKCLINEVEPFGSCDLM